MYNQLLTKLPEPVRARNGAALTDRLIPKGQQWMPLVIYTHNEKWKVVFIICVQIYRSGSYILYYCYTET